VLEPNRTTRLTPLVAAVIATAAVAAVVALVQLAQRNAAETELAGQFEYDVSAHQKTDKSLLLYREVDPIVLADLSHPAAIAVDSEGNCYVAGDGLLVGYAAEGAERLRLDVGVAASCLAVADHGRIYLGHEGTLKAYDLDGTAAFATTVPERKAQLTSIAVTPNEILVADAGSRLVWRYADTGKRVGRIGDKDLDPRTPGFIVPSPYFDVSLGADGLVWVANPGRTRLEAFTADGTFELAWGKASLKPAGFSGCCNPAHFACDPRGGFITSEKGLLRVKRYDESGTFEGFVAGPEELGTRDGTVSPDDPTAAEQALDVAVDASGRVFVLQPSRRQVRVFEPLPQRDEG